MARAALRISLTELAKLSGVSEKTIRRCEAVDGPPNAAQHSLNCIGQALMDQGVRFSEGRGRRWGPSCALDWNPEAGERQFVHQLIQLEGDPEAGGPRFDWVPPPKKPGKPNS